jgi:arabinofuranan 3-O-arabinosyltransferase
MPRGPTNWLRIKVLGVRGTPRIRDSQVGIEEISVPGVHASRTIEAPAVPLPGGGDPAAIVLAKAEPQPTGCMLTPARWVCSPELQTPTEEQYGFDESFTVPRASSASLSGSAVLTDPALVQRYAFGGQQVRIAASSSYTDDPQDQAYAAFDADPRTAWISGATDTRPRLQIGWRGARSLRSITVLRPAGAADLLQLQITGSAGQVRNVILGRPNDTGRDVVRFAPMTTSSLTLAFSGAYGAGPVQITDVVIPGVQQLSAHPAAPLRLGCGRGPTVLLNGTAVATRATGTVADILASRPLTFTACSAVPMAAGRTTIIEPAADAFSVQGLTVIRDSASATIGPASATAPPPSGVRTLAWTAARRVVRVNADQLSYLIVGENFNAGWQASLHGRDLQPVRLDGWKQGWLLPAGSRGLVTLTYRPDYQYRVALFAGLAGLCLIIVLAAVPLRRRSASVRRRPSKSVRWRPSGPSSLRRPAWVRALGICLTVLLGLWIGGYPGAGLLPVLALGFLAAIARRESSGLARVAAAPWVITALLVLAACCAAAGNELWTHGVGGAMLTALSGVIPVLCCLAVAGRLVAALLSGGQQGGLDPDTGDESPGYLPET